MATLLGGTHPILVHFPIALLVVGILLSYATLWKSELLETTWLFLLIGGLATLPATISGIIAHFPYEVTDLHDVIERHQLLGFASTLLFLMISAASLPTPLSLMLILIKLFLPLPT